MSDVSAGPAEACRVVEPDRRTPVTRHAEDSRPRVCNRHLARRGEESDENLAQGVDGFSMRPAIVVGLRPVAVRNAAPTDGDPVVCGSLRIAVGVRHVAERFVAVPADLRPGLFRQWVSDDHRGVHW